MPWVDMSTTAPRSAQLTGLGRFRAMVNASYATSSVGLGVLERRELVRMALAVRGSCLARPIA